MVTADDLEAALSSMVATLNPATDRDWSVRAGTLEWDCWHTAEHIGDGCGSFEVRGQAPSVYWPWVVVPG